MKLSISGVAKLRLKQHKGLQDVNRALAIDRTIFQAYLTRAAYYGARKQVNSLSCLQIDTLVLDICLACAGSLLVLSLCHGLCIPSHLELSYSFVRSSNFKSSRLIIGNIYHCFRSKLSDLNSLILIFDFLYSSQRR